MGKENLIQSDVERRLVWLCAVEDIEEEDCIQILPDDLPPLAVYRVSGDEIYVTEDTCTHGQASLGEEGYLDGHIIECTWHDGRFDIRTGEVVAMPCEKPLKTFPVTVKDGDVYVSVQESTPEIIE
ncbi:MAG: non-heme iron oxygenase ferredoxin subunit [Halieaceae bacterium]|nr:non-heme iron oxygenase ferredoxin subunit [Halieaceae bacterium]